MTTTTEIPIPEEAAPRGRIEKRKKWKWFGIGLAVRLVGVALLWLGDGHDSLFRKGLVIVGVILSIGGIGILRFLLFFGFRRVK
jgi:NADH:ubiquinone oxidoreductase subunit 4 (subunit M)